MQLRHTASRCGASCEFVTTDTWLQPCAHINVWICGLVTSMLTHRQYAGRPSRVHIEELNDTAQPCGLVLSTWARRGHSAAASRLQTSLPSR